jgi:uncharacterized protein (DUF58 family)
VTSLGWRTLTFGLICMLGGALLGWTVIASIGATLVVVCVGALLVLLRPPELALERRIVPDRASKGSIVLCHLQVRNRAPYVFRGAPAFQLVGPDEVMTMLPRLLPGERTLFNSRLPTSRRGRHEVGPVTLRRYDPFGLAVVERRYAQPGELLVYPRDLGFRSMRTALMQSLDGSTDDTSPRGSMVFHQLREYVPGDDVRRIHWKATARVAHTGTLIVRQDVDVARPATVLLVDTRPAGYSPESFELALDAAASVLIAARAAKSPVEVRFTDGTVIPPGRRIDDPAALEALAVVGPAGNGSLTREVDRLRRSRGGAALVVVTGLTEDVEASRAASLRGVFRRIILLSVTPDFRPPRSFAGLTTVQGSDAESLVRGWDVAVRR